jgi:hypothetical protein
MLRRSELVKRACMLSPFSDEHAAVLARHLSYSLVRRMPKLIYRLPCRIAHTLGRLVYTSSPNYLTTPPERLLMC